MGNIKSNMKKEASNNLKLKNSLLIESSLQLKRNKSEIMTIYKEETKADLLRLSGNYEQALIEYNQELKLTPNNFYLLNNKAIVLEHLGMYEEAIEIYDLIISINKRFYKAYFNKGNVFFDLCLYENAIENYNCALKINPNYIEALINKGIAIEELSDDKICRDIYKYLLDPSYIKFKPKESIIKDIECIIIKILKHQQSSNFEITYAQAELLCCFKQYETAIEKYNACLKLKPDCCFTYNSKGLALEKLSLDDLALTAYSKAIKINPNYFQAAFNKANVLLDKELYELAIEAYDVALKIKPNSKEAILNKKIAYDSLSTNKPYDDDIDDFEVS
jgi:tetratricopeptide (TPR) repeat protein